MGAGNPLDSRTVTQPAAANDASVHALTYLCRAPKPTFRSQLSAWLPGAAERQVDRRTHRFFLLPPIDSVVDREMEQTTSGSRVPSLVLATAVKRHADSGADAAASRATSHCVDSLPRVDSCLRCASGFDHAKVLVLVDVGFGFPFLERLVTKSIRHLTTQKR